MNFQIWYYFWISKLCNWYAPSHKWRYESYPLVMYLSFHWLSDLRFHIGYLFFSVLNLRPHISTLGPRPFSPPSKKWPLQFQRVGWYNRDEIKITHKNVVIFKNITCIEKNKHPNKLNSLFTDVNLHKLKFS